MFYKKTVNYLLKLSNLKTSPFELLVHYPGSREDGYKQQKMWEIINREQECVTRIKLLI